MIKQDVDMAVVGGGPAGLAAAVSAKEHGAKNVLILDRNNWLGGILSQCIHDGFGVEETGASMTGPEYADMYIKSVEKNNVKILTETMVLNFDKKLNITAVNREGIHLIKSKAIVLAMGCREKTRWNIMTPGTRPSGIYTAGVAQAFVNLYNIMPGKNVLIVGSGDVGLIIARRLKFEGANVLGVVEILPYASGLPRNVVQCLDDYDIPLFLNHTITKIEGKERLEEVTISQVDKNMKPIPGKSRNIKCDTLLLSLGLIPENELSKEAGIKLDKITGGPVVDQDLETSLEGVFACGNCLQVYDIVDLLSLDAKNAGRNAAEHISGKMKNKKNKCRTIAGKNVRYVTPQIINNPGKIYFNLRPKKPSGPSTLCVSSSGKEIFKKKLPYVNPANMIRFDADISNDTLESADSLEVSINA